MERRVRVRFAPSPTGPLHIGGVRTALFNYLFARQHGGDFLLRIEDTDSTRYVPGAEGYIFESLRWCGLRADEGVEEGGPHGPYRQSERKAIYLKYAEELVAKGWAYYAFDTAEELTRLRTEHEAEGKAFAYGPNSRQGLRNSLTLPPDEVARRLKEDPNWVVRFQIPANRTVVMDDLIRGRVEVHTDTLDDKVLYKHADGLPTYHLANIVDDHLMEISHVIRGEEWLPSLPLHYLLYEAFGWTDTMPRFAHLPLILKPTGNGKLSKRDGDKMGFPVFPLEWKTATGEVYRGYREDGYLPSAFLNMLALLGWNPGNEQEVFSLGQLVELFSLERVSKSGARFDPERAKWFNHAHLMLAPVDVLTRWLGQCLKGKGIEPTPERLERAVGLVRERVNLLPDLWAETDYLWQAPAAYDEKAVKKHTTPDSPAWLALLAGTLEQHPNSSADTIAEVLNSAIEVDGWPKGKVMNTLRLALVGESRGVDVASIIEFLGVGEAVKRVKALQQYLGGVC